MSTPLTVTLDAVADVMPGLEHAAGDDQLQGSIIGVGGIPGATSEGRAGVAVLVQLPDGSTVLGQTTLALLHNATRALAGRYPDDRP